MNNNKDLRLTNDEEAFQQIKDLVEENNKKILEEISGLKSTFEKRAEEDEGVKIKKGVVFNLQVRFFLTMVLAFTLEVALIISMQPPIFICVVVAILAVITLFVWIAYAFGLRHRTPEEINDLYDHHNSFVSTLKLIIEFCGFYALIVEMFL